jgi:hypothetical protein
MEIVRRLIPGYLKAYGKRQERPEKLGHQTFNQEVAGSIPAALTSKKPSLGRWLRVASQHLVDERGKIL